MRLQNARSRLLAAASLISCSFAFQDTSPHFIISSSSFSQPSHEPIVSTSQFLDVAKSLISACPSDAYILVSQPGLESGDFASATSSPHLREAIAAATPKDRAWVVPDVFEDKNQNQELILESLARATVEECEAEREEVDAKTGSFASFDDMKPKVIRVDFEPIPVGASTMERRRVVEHNDALLHAILQLLPTEKYTIIYTSTSIASEAAAQRHSTQQSFSELKARAEDGSVSRNSTLAKKGLFHKYQFFTPALFMGYLTFFFLAIILYVGISAVSSLSVSYGAFDKENGPAAMKKQ